MTHILTRGAALIMIAVLFLFGSVPAFAAESPTPTISPDILDTLHNPGSPKNEVLWGGSGAPPSQAPDNTEVLPPLTFATPEPTPTPEPAPTVPPLYPADVRGVEENGARLIIKTYELGEGESPDGIPRGGFESDGWRYELSDIIRKDTAYADTREHAETVTVNTATKEMSEIMPALSPTLDFTSEDGYAGTLELEITTIKIGIKYCLNLK